MTENKNNLKNDIDVFVRPKKYRNFTGIFVAAK